MPLETNLKRKGQIEGDLLLIIAYEAIWFE